MNLDKWLDREPGRTAALALHFDITSASISQWRTRGVPVDRMLEVRRLTHGEVTLEDMIRQRTNGKGG